MPSAQVAPEARSHTTHTPRGRQRGSARTTTPATASHGAGAGRDARGTPYGPGTPGSAPRRHVKSAPALSGMNAAISPLTFIRAGLPALPPSGKGPMAVSLERQPRPRLAFLDADVELEWTTLRWESGIVTRRVALGLIAVMLLMHGTVAAVASSSGDGAGAAWAYTNWVLWLRALIPMACFGAVLPGILNDFRVLQRYTKMAALGMGAWCAATVGIHAWAACNWRPEAADSAAAGRGWAYSTPECATAAAGALPGSAVFALALAPHVLPAGLKTAWWAGAAAVAPALCILIAWTTAGGPAGDDGVADAPRLMSDTVALVVVLWVNAAAATALAYLNEAADRDSFAQRLDSEAQLTRARQLIKQRDDARMEAQRLRKSLLVEGERRTRAQADKARLEGGLNRICRELWAPASALHAALGEVAGEAELPSWVAGRIGNAVESSQATLRVISEVVDLAKLRARSLRLQYREVNLRTLLRECAQTAQVTAQVPISLHVAPSVPLLVLQDERRVKQLVMSGLVKAMRFTSAGQVDVRVSLPPLEDTEPQFLVEVFDTGVGLMGVDPETLFEDRTLMPGSPTALPGRRHTPAHSRSHSHPRSHSQSQPHGQAQPALHTPVGAGTPGGPGTPTTGAAAAAIAQATAAAAAGASGGGTAGVAAGVISPSGRGHRGHSPSGPHSGSGSAVSSGTHAAGHGGGGGGGGGSSNGNSRANSSAARRRGSLAGVEGWLSLPACRQLVELLDGEMGLHERKDGVRGCCFWFRLPCRPAAAANGTPAGSSEAMSSGDRWRTGGASDSELDGAGAAAARDGVNIPFRLPAGAGPSRGRSNDGSSRGGGGGGGARRGDSGSNRAGGYHTADSFRRVQHALGGGGSASRVWSSGGVRSLSGHGITVTAAGAGEGAGEPPAGAGAPATASATAGTPGAHTPAAGTPTGASSAAAAAAVAAAAGTPAAAVTAAAAAAAASAGGGQADRGATSAAAAAAAAARRTAGGADTEVFPPLGPGHHHLTQQRSVVVRMTRTASRATDSSLPLYGAAGADSMGGVSLPALDNEESDDGGDDRGSHTADEVDDLIAGILATGPTPHHGSKHGAASGSIRMHAGRDAVGDTTLSALGFGSSLRASPTHARGHGHGSGASRHASRPPAQLLAGLGGSGAGGAPGTVVAVAAVSSPYSQTGTVAEDAADEAVAAAATAAAGPGPGSMQSSPARTSHGSHESRGASAVAPGAVSGETGSSGADNARPTVAVDIASLDAATRTPPGQLPPLRAHTAVAAASAQSIRSMGMAGAPLGAPAGSPPHREAPERDGAAPVVAAGAESPDTMLLAGMGDVPPLGYDMGGAHDDAPTVAELDAAEAEAQAEAEAEAQAEAQAEAEAEAAAAAAEAEAEARGEGNAAHLQRGLSSGSTPVWDGGGGSDPHMASTPGAEGSPLGRGQQGGRSAAAAAAALVADSPPPARAVPGAARGMLMRQTSGGDGM